MTATASAPCMPPAVAMFAAARREATIALRVAFTTRSSVDPAWKTFERAEVHAASVCALLLARGETDLAVAQAEGFALLRERKMRALDHVARRRAARRVGSR